MKNKAIKQKNAAKKKQKNAAKKKSAQKKNTSLYDDLFSYRETVSFENGSSQHASKKNQHRRAYDKEQFTSDFYSILDEIGEKGLSEEEGLDLFINKILNNMDLPKEIGETLAAGLRENSDSKKKNSFSDDSSSRYGGGFKEELFLNQQEIPEARTIDDALFIPDQTPESFAAKRNRTRKEKDRQMEIFAFGCPQSGHLTFTAKMFEPFCLDDQEGEIMLLKNLEVLDDTVQQWDPLRFKRPIEELLVSDGNACVMSEIYLPAAFAAAAAPVMNRELKKNIMDVDLAIPEAREFADRQQVLLKYESSIGLPAESLKRLVSYDNHFYDLMPDVYPELYLTMIFLKVMNTMFIRSLRDAGTAENMEFINSIRLKHLRAQTRYMQTHLLALQDSIQGKELPKSLF